MPGIKLPAMLGLTTTAAALAVGGAVAPAPAAAAARVVLSPAPGERIARGPVRVAVRAGREKRDLRATLNGVAIGAEFRRFPGSLRRLPVSRSHGLRHGVNVLRVRARVRGVTRTATVRFRVVHRRPLAGAGRDTRAAVGVPLRLRGRFAPHPSRATRSRRVRWTVVKAPAGSRLLGRRRAARRGGKRAVASQTTVAPAPLELPAAGLTPSFTPDVQGRFVLQMSAEHPDGTASDTVAVDVVPRSATVFLDTAVDGPDPQGTTSYGSPADAARRSGIRVGDTVYRMPWMQVRDGVGSDVGKVPGSSTQYSATFQVLVLDRRTLALVSNRVYGHCALLPPNGIFGQGCAPGDDGRLVRASLGDDVRALGPERLVIAVAQPLRGTRIRDDWTIGGPGALRPIGVDEYDPMWPRGGSAWTDGRMAAIGVPGMQPGDARVTFVPNGRAELWGYLSADDTNHFGFVPGARVAFDSRTSAACDGPAPTGGCTVTQTVGDQTLTGRLEKGTAGYLVSLHDRWTLARKDSRTFGTGARDGGAAVRAMADFLTARAAQDSVVTITSLTTPGKAITTDPGTSAADWKRLAEAVASVGGTRHRFNSAASTANADYSVIGWSGAGEGAGDEIAVRGARLRGALVPDQRSHFVPVNVTADGPAAERLQQLILRTPQNAWPLDDDPGARAALAWLGAQVPQLGPHPRSAYWLKGTTLDTDKAITAIEALAMPVGVDLGFGAADFAKARAQLLQELRWVGNVRSYLDQLSRPYLATIQQAFPASTTLADRLEVELNVAREEAEFSADWFELVEALLSFAGGFEGFLGHEAAHIANFVLETSTSAMEASRFGYESNFDGSAAEIDDDRRVRADELARALTDDAQASIAGLERMGNAIVSDPTKLAELGRYGGCNPDGGCPEGYEEYGISQADVTEAVELASLSLERTLYGQLMTRSFPVWDTGLARDPRPYERFICAGGYSLNSPFDGNPELAAAKSLEELDPTGAATRWRTSIAVTRNQWVYAWPSEKVLNRMFGPVNLLNPEAGGLGMTPQDVYRERQVVYEPGVRCRWEYLLTVGNQEVLRPEPQPEE